LFYEAAGFVQIADSAIETADILILCIVILKNILS